MTDTSPSTDSWVRDAVLEVGARQHEIARIVAAKYGADLAEDATSDAFLDALARPEKLEGYAARLGHRPSEAETLAFLVTAAKRKALDIIRDREGSAAAGPRTFVSWDDQDALEADSDLEDVEFADEGLVVRSRYDELLTRLPEEFQQIARIVLVEMAGPREKRMKVAEAIEVLGLEDEGDWIRLRRKFGRRLEKELEGEVAGGWCADHRDRIAKLVASQLLGEIDGPEKLHLQHCEACFDYALFAAAGVRDRAAVVLPPIPGLAGAGLFATISAKFSALFSSGEAATTIGGGAAGGGLLTAGGALKACGGLAVGCAAVLGGSAVVEKVQADPEPPAAARSAPAPRVAARPIATVAPVATPSAAQVRSQERAQRRAASKAKRTARREQRASADAAFKVSSAARSARSAAPTQSDKALGLSSAPPAPSRSAPASAGSGGGGGGASDAPTSADKAFGLSTGGG